MTSTLTLPIKCSTVKRYHEQMQNIMFGTSILYAIVSVVCFIFWGFVSVNQLALEPNAYILAVLIAVGIVWGFFLVAVSIKLLLDDTPLERIEIVLSKVFDAISAVIKKIPIIKCIKDE